MKSFSSLDQILGTRGAENPVSRITSPLSGESDFQPLFAAGSAVKKSRLDAFAVREPASEEVAHEEAPQVELVQENGRVVKIIVTCRCCERIELDCAY